MSAPRKPILDANLLARLLQRVAQTLPKELTCDECLGELDRFAEMVLLGQPAEKAMPLVAQHLAVCEDCREEFEALLRALQALEDELPPAVPPVPDPEF